jgi:hypothetical protein
MVAKIDEVALGPNFHGSIEIELTGDVALAVRA